jgi:dGTP triphosphohydrolase
MTADFDAEQVVQQVADNLRKRFPSLEPAEVESAALQSVEEYTGRPVQDYISVLAERAAKNRLRKAHPDATEAKKADR